MKFEYRIDTLVQHPTVQFSRSCYRSYNQPSSPSLCSLCSFGGRLLASARPAGPLQPFFPRPSPPPRQRISRRRWAIVTRTNETPQFRSHARSSNSSFDVVLLRGHFSAPCLRGVCTSRAALAWEFLPFIGVEGSCHGNLAMTELLAVPKKWVS